MIDTKRLILKPLRMREFLLTHLVGICVARLYDTDLMIGKFHAPSGERDFRHVATQRNPISRLDRILLQWELARTQRAWPPVER